MRSQTIINAVAAERGVEAAAILSRDRSASIVAARREAIKRMKAAKMPTSTIAGALDLDVSTVLYHSSPKMNKRKREYRSERYVKVEQPPTVRVKIRREYLPKLAELAALTDASIEAAVNQAVSDMLESA